MATSKSQQAVTFWNKQVKKDFANCLDSTTAQRFLVNLEMAAWGVELETKWKSLGALVGPEAIELIRNGRPAKRCVYVVEAPGKVVVLHVFKKTCEGVDRKNMATAKARYKDWMDSLPPAE